MTIRVALVGIAERERHRKTLPSAVWAGQVDRADDDRDLTLGPGVAIIWPRHEEPASALDRCLIDYGELKRLTP